MILKVTKQTHREVEKTKDLVNILQNENRNFSGVGIPEEFLQREEEFEDIPIQNTLEEINKINSKLNMNFNINSNLLNSSEDQSTFSIHPPEILHNENGKENQIENGEIKKTLDRKQMEKFEEIIEMFILLDQILNFTRKEYLKVKNVELKKRKKT